MLINRVFSCLVFRVRFLVIGLIQEIVTQPSVIRRHFSGLCIHSNEPKISVLIKLEMDRIDSVKLYSFFSFVLAVVFFFSRQLFL